MGRAGQGAAIERKSADFPTADRRGYKIPNRALDNYANQNYVVRTPARLRDVAHRHDTLGRDAMDAAGVRRVRSPGETPAAYGEVVWSWRRDRGVYPLRPCGVGNGDNKRRSPGRARISRQTIAWGKPGCLGCTCLIRVRCFFFARGAAGAVSARLSLRPLSERGTNDWQNPGEARRGNADP